MGMNAPAGLLVEGKGHGRGEPQESEGGCCSRGSQVHGAKREPGPSRAVWWEACV